MKKKFNSKQIKVFDPIRLEMRVWTSLEKGLKAEGVSIGSRLIEHLIDFGEAVIQLQNLKKIGSKRSWEDNFEFRLHTIHRIIQQLKQDEPIVNDFLGEDFLTRQLYFAILEKATIIFERSHGKDIRDMSHLDYQLFKLVKTLKAQKVPKPMETLAAAIQRSECIKELSASGINVSTLQNRISRAKKNINVPKKLEGKSPIQVATEFLQKEFPGQSKLIAELSYSLPKMKSLGLYKIVPVSSKFVFPYLFD